MTCKTNLKTIDMKTSEVQTAEPVPIPNYTVDHQYIRDPPTLSKPRNRNLVRLVM